MALNAEQNKLLDQLIDSMSDDEDFPFGKRSTMDVVTSLLNGEGEMWEDEEGQLIYYSGVVAEE